MWERMMRAARLEVMLYEEVEANPALTQEAVLVVLVVTAANLVGQLVQSLFTSVSVAGAMAAGVWALIGFFIWAWIAYFVGTRLFNGTADYGELIRTLGYAYTPNLLGVFSFIPCLGPLVGLIGSIWALVAMVVAIRQALDFDTTRAILTVIVGFFVYLFGLMLLRMIVGLPAVVPSAG